MTQHNRAHNSTLKVWHFEISLQWLAFMCWILDLGPRGTLGRNEKYRLSPTVIKKLHPKSVFVVQTLLSNRSRTFTYLSFYRTLQKLSDPWKEESGEWNISIQRCCIKKDLHHWAWRITFLSLSKEFLGQICYEVAICTSTSTKHLTSTTVGIPVTLQHLPFGPKRPLNHSRLIFKRITNLK